MNLLRPRPPGACGARASLLAAAALLLLASAASALTEKEILTNFHNDLNGDNWNRPWDLSSPSLCDPSSYPGVTCNDDGRVSEIDISDNNAAGNVNPHVYTLRYLEKLDLSKNRITNGGWNRIPDVVAGEADPQSLLLGPVEVIDLTNNLVNTVAGVDALKGTLTELHMSFNNLRGKMPDELFQLRNLEVLAISENEIDGAVDPRLGSLTNLREFYCYGNKVTGRIPTEVGRLAKMQILTFAENKLSGPLPDEIKNLGNLQTFSVHNNDPDTGSHTGPLPAFDGHPFLNELYLDGNDFTGHIPSYFMAAYNRSLDSTVTIGLSNNQLVGPLPAEFLEFDSLVLNVQGNSVTGLHAGIYGKLCDAGGAEIGGWMNGLVERFGCDAILCAKGTWNKAGRQEDEDSPCEVCPGGTFNVLGAMTCGMAGGDSDAAGGSGSAVGGGSGGGGPDSDMSQLEILAEFYLSLGGAKWDDAGGWDSFADLEGYVDLTLPTYQDENGDAIMDECKFRGVVCAGADVIEIALPNNGLDGMVPPSLWNLPKLQELDLSGNEVKLDRDNGFGDIGNAALLRKVDLSSNDIRSFKGIGRATSLEELYVDDGYFYGQSIGDEVFDLAGLKILHVQFGGLKGKVPGLKLSKLQNLRALNLYGNELTGTIPTEIGLMTKLWHIDFSENDMTGHLPTLALKKLPDLQKLHVHQSSRGGKGIIGRLPAFAEQTQLHMLDLNSNQMTGPIPEDFLSGVVDPTRLMEVDISYNDFTGTIPNSLSRFTNMRFDAVKNRMDGVGPGLCNQRGWFNGEVGRVIDDGRGGCNAIMCPAQTYNDYGRARASQGETCKSCPSNQFAGQTTCDANGDGQPDTPNANSEKEILDKLYAATGGKNWTKGTDTWTEGAVCRYEGVTCLVDRDDINEGVTEINLPGFGLKGDIPTLIWRLPSLQKVDFTNNVVGLGFTGIGQATTLEEILMDKADLVGVAGISKAPALKKLHIARNSFPEGTIPDELYKIPTLESLAIAHNSFSGQISPDIKNLGQLKEFWAGGNELTGSIPTEMAQLSNLESLVLADNRLSGQIPDELESIQGLKQLHLNSQRDFGGFTGPLPAFQYANHLGDLDFSHNSLTGSIPDAFLEMVRKSPNHDIYAYDTIKLSSNQLTGTIPADWDDFVGIFADLANNMITGVPSVLCDDDDEFMNNMVGELSENKCDAILCPPGTFTEVGRQTEVGSPCKPCSGGTEDDRKEQAPYFGSTMCKSISGERKILEQLHGLIFSGASEDNYWMSNNPICSWQGITCGDDENSKAQDSGVTQIRLESNSLFADDSAKVSKLFFSLPNLERLNIRGNQGLTLTFDDIGNAPRLTMLQLSATGLTSIDGIDKATTLKELHITENDMEGPFPRELLDLKSMELLYMSFNKFTGTLPTEIGELTGLRELYAYTNQLTGTLPTELGLLLEMENLVLGQNSFRGQLPTELNKLASLKEFSVYYGGGLTGHVLDFANVKQIEKLDLEGNKFSGTLPNNFLGGLDLQWASEPDNEVILHLADNSLNGQLPSTLLNIKNLYLDIVGNHFKQLPPSFCQQSLWMNGKVGELNSCHAIACPINFASSTGRISGGGDECTPCGNDESATFIGSYTCSHVDLEFLALKKLYQQTKGATWTKNEHWMDYSTPICSWYGIDCVGGEQDNNTVTQIKLPSNNLDGTMPPEIFAISTLKTLNLKSNNVFMKFDNVDKAKNLEMLYISDVDIGSIDGIWKAPSLRELHLTANELTGEIPDAFFDLADTMERLYIAYNSFSGKLSKQFGKMKNLIDFYAYDNDFTGTIPAEFASIKSIQNFVVAENKLSGTIPTEFGNMPNLVLFSAYRRLKPGPKLSGPLPSFANVPKLEGLYLDYNHLAGTIPANFLQASLHTKLITISHNLLGGRVPLQLASFDALNIEMEGNKITEVSPSFCADDKKTWMNGLMGTYGCDSLMCRPGTYSPYGRQNSTQSSCQKCDPGEDPSPYWGSTSCDSIVDEREILTLLYNSCGGENWHNSNNWLKNNDICTWYGVDCREGEAVQALRLGSNNLIKTPPMEIFRLRQLHTLWLHSNPIKFDFTGIDKAQNLVELRLDSTGLSNIFGIGKGTSLVRLDLKYNRISGPFPQALLKLDKLESLSLTDNRLTGNLPNDFGKLTNLIHLRLGSNMFSGKLKSFSDLKQLLHLDLSDNDLEGTIPKNFLDSISARKPIEVDLSSNKLSGGLPLELDRLDELVIYLRDNRFSSLDPSLCDSDNHKWNLREVQMYGCNAIMCPPGTASYHGRQSGENVPCLKCASNSRLYGQTTCNGAPLEASSSSRVGRGLMAAFLSSLFFGISLVL